MRKVSKRVKVELLNFTELPFEDQELITLAAWARKKAQAPYSNYWVGAAVRSESSRHYLGCNVETASWTQTTHAEQNAVTSMIAREGPAKVVAMAIVGAPEGTDVKIVDSAVPRPDCQVGDFCFACGHCLQIVWENCMADPSVRLLLLTSWGEVARTTIGDAFPMRFGPESLGVEVRREVE